MNEARLYDEALKGIEENKSKILDKISLLELTGEIFMKKQCFDEAIAVYEQLLERNHENTIYYNQLIDAHQLHDPDSIVNLLESFHLKYPKSLPPSLLMLK